MRKENPFKYITRIIISVNNKNLIRNKFKSFFEIKLALYIKLSIKSIKLKIVIFKYAYDKYLKMNMNAKILSLHFYINLTMIYSSLTL